MVSIVTVFWSPNIVMWTNFQNLQCCPVKVPQRTGKVFVDNVVPVTANESLQTPFVLIPVENVSKSNRIWQISENKEDLCVKKQNQTCKFFRWTCAQRSNRVWTWSTSFVSTWVTRILDIGAVVSHSTATCRFPTKISIYQMQSKHERIKVEVNLLENTANSKCCGTVAVNWAAIVRTFSFRKTCSLNLDRKD